MRIRTKLSIIAAIPIAVFMISMLFLFIFNREIANSQKSEEVCDEIMRLTADLLVLTYEYSIMPKDRPMIQWETQYNVVQNRLKESSAHFDRPFDKRLFHDIEQKHKTVGAIFSEYIAYNKGLPSGDISELHSELRISMFNRLILELQGILPVAEKLHNNNYEVAKRYSYYESLMIVIIVLLFALFISPISFLIISNISKSLNAIHAGMKVVAQGDLQSRIAMDSADEIGILAQGFNEMTDQLSSTTVSRNELLKEIEERRRAEDALEQATIEWSAAMDASDDKVCLLDLNLHITRWNKAFYSMAGRRGEISPGRNILKLFRPEGGPVVCPICRALEGKRDAVVIMEENDPDNPAGCPVEVTVKIIRDRQEQPTSILISFHDLTHDRKVQEEKAGLQSQLYQSQKMEAVGHLAGGIAHDFNNMLTAIIGYCSLLGMKLEKDSPLRSYLEEILSSAEKSANLTRQLLAFSRKQIIAPKETDLNELIRGMEKLLLRLIGEDIELKTELTDKTLTIMVDPGQIEQVIMNLCTNARDAMPQGGLLSLCTDTVELDKDYVVAHDLQKPGTYALISVTDTGNGMDAKTLERIFEPFYTTKEINRGTGLGLAIVYGVIKQHNGNITVYSEPEKGTTFKIYLPLIKAAPEKQEAKEVVVPQGGVETILIAEDNEEVRVLTKRVLEEAGYNIIVASDGEDAINKFKKHMDDIQLIILDVIMPKKSGKEAEDEIKILKPDCRVLYTSGYTADIISRKGILNKGIDFISKPVTPHDLLNKVRQMLDKKQG